METWTADTTMLTDTDRVRHSHSLGFDLSLFLWLPVSWLG